MSDFSGDSGDFSGDFGDSGKSYDPIPVVHSGKGMHPSDSERGHLICGSLFCFYTPNVNVLCSS